LLAGGPQIQLLVARCRTRNFRAVYDANPSVRQRIGCAANNRRACVPRQRGCCRKAKYRLSKKIQPDSAPARQRIQIDQQRDALTALQRLEQFGHGKPLEDDLIAAMAAQLLENAHEMRVAELFHHDGQGKSE